MWNISFNMNPLSGNKALITVDGKKTPIVSHLIFYYKLATASQNKLISLMTSSAGNANLYPIVDNTL